MKRAGVITAIISIRIFCRTGIPMKEALRNFPELLKKLGPMVKAETMIV
jgi:hypothetical protein